MSVWRSEKAEWAAKFAANYWKLPFQMQRNGIKPKTINSKHNLGDGDTKMLRLVKT